MSTREAIASAIYLTVIALLCAICLHTWAVIP